MMKIKKMIATVTIIMVTLAITIVPCFAATSIGDLRGDELPYSTFAAQNEWIDLYFGSGSLHISGNKYGYNTSYASYGQFYAEAPGCNYSVFNDEGRKMATLSNVSGNVTFDEFLDYAYCTTELFTFSNVDNSYEGDYLSGFTAKTVPRWYQEPSLYQLPYYSFNTSSEYTNINAVAVFEVYSVVNDEWTLVPYEYTGSISGAEAPIGNRLSLRGFVNDHWEQFVRDSGYFDGPVRFSLTCDVQHTNPQPFANGTGFGIFLCGDAYAINDNAMKLPVSTVNESINIFGWLTSGVDRFLKVEIFPDFTISTLLLMGLAIPAFYAVLKMLGGVG